MITGVFFFSLFCLFYIYLGYPLLIYLLAKLKPGKIKKNYQQPTISIIVIAYNEEKNIIKRIDNLLSLKYPPKQREIIIVSDGSLDSTVELVKQKNIQDIKLVEFKEHRGKPACINQAVATCRGDILIFADARQRYDYDALIELVANFSDPSIGAVSGELLFELEDKNIIGQGLDFYWHYEKFLRKRESQFDSTIGATGAIYAIRRKLFKPILDDIILDDVIIPMNIVLAGYRTIFDGRAKAYDYLAKTQEKEEARKIRTIAGNFQLFFLYPKLLNPFKNRIFWQTLSHKFSRLIAPLFIFSLFVTNLYLINDYFFRLFFILQIFFYFLAIIGCFLREQLIRMKIFSLPYSFIMLNLVTLKAFFVFLFGDMKKIWYKDTI